MCYFLRTWAGQVDGSAIPRSVRIKSAPEADSFMPIAYSRPPKLNDADTVLYEIYMLRFAAKRLVRERGEEPQDAWVYLEAFLVHYRNLIEFLGKQNNI